ncbi:MAG: hypothetical protein ABIK82_17400 [Pseudomonadota bacterium]|jgi:hypothetical protein
MPPVTRNEAMKFWQYCREYLALKTDLVNVSELAAIEERQDPHTLSMPGFYLRLLKSLTNRQGMPNSIGDIERIRGVLCNFSPKKVADVYGKDWKLLFRTIKKDVKPSSRMDIDIPQNYWVVFSKGALDCATFLSGFASAKALATEITHFADSESFSAGLPKVLALEIHGYGFPLACDFLKECGWTQYAKADVHTKKILEHVGLSDGSDYDTFRAMQVIARHIKETPYAVDKHIWLIGSGNLYNRHETFPTSREEFFRFLEHHG